MVTECVVPSTGLRFIQCIAIPSLQTTGARKLIQVMFLQTHEVQLSRQRYISQIIGIILQCDEALDLQAMCQQLFQGQV